MSMALNEITAIMPIKTTGVTSKIIFITKALKMIDAMDDEYIEVTLRPFKSKSPTVEIEGTRKGQKRTRKGQKNELN